MKRQPAKSRSASNGRHRAGGSHDPVRTVLAFVEAVNRHDLDAIADLMDEEHLFTDAVGTRIEGRERMIEGWRTYFGWFPDYRIEHAEVLRSGKMVGVFGTASGTYGADISPQGGERWESPAAWLARVHRGRLREWRVFCDVSGTMRILERHQVLRTSVVPGGRDF